MENIPRMTNITKRISAMSKGIILASVEKILIPQNVPSFLLAERKIKKNKTAKAITRTLVTISCTLWSIGEIRLSA